MSIKKTLLMLTLNYILIFAWMFWFRLGLLSALIIFPLTMFVAFLDTFFSEGRMSAYLWCGNLLIATLAGILLQAYLFIRATGDSNEAILRAIVEIPVAVLLIGIIAVISGHEASKLKKSRRQRRLSQGMDMSPAYTESDAVDDDMGDSGAEDFFAERRVRQSMQLDSGIEDEYDDNTEEEDEDEDNEPLFRVIKKS